jgi:ABC-2 type transport system permease protein
MRKIQLIIAREFMERVRKKSFIIATLLTPLLTVGLMIAPTLFMFYGTSDQKQVVVVDRSGLVADKLTATSEVMFVDQSHLSKREACSIYGEDSGMLGVLYIGGEIEHRDSVQLITNESSSVMIEDVIRQQLNGIIEREKLRAHNIENLDEILASVATNIELATYENNGTGEEATMESTSSGISYVLGLVLGMMLYMLLILYGQMVLTSVVEEKSSRVIDVMVTSSTPFQIMMGKILGIALVAVTQIAIWALLVIAASKFLVPALFSDNVVMANDMMLASIVGTLTDTSYLAMLFGLLLLFVVGGFLLYAALYAAAGSAVDSVQEGQQYNTIIMMPIILAMLVMTTIFNDPNSPLAYWASMIPLTSPIVMMARIPYEIPLWEIVLSAVSLYATFIAVVWGAGKIYRVGILMHGKKPNLKELLRWIKYK